MNGDGARAGFKQVLAERKQADLGTNGLGRLVISTPTATSVSVAEDAVSPFGLKLAGVSSTISGATTTAPGGSPPATSIDLSAATPQPGQSYTLNFNLPDGTTSSVTLTATTSTTPGQNEFTIGATASATATSLQTARDGEHRLGGLNVVDRGLGGASRQRLFQRGLDTSAAARRRPAVRHSDCADRRYPRQHGVLVHRRRCRRCCTQHRNGADRSPRSR